MKSYRSHDNPLYIFDYDIIRSTWTISQIVFIIVQQSWYQMKA